MEALAVNYIDKLVAHSGKLSDLCKAMALCAHDIQGKQKMFPIDIVDALSPFLYDTTATQWAELSKLFSGIGAK